ncbi:hypothetical protein PENTCL1PPCAC_26837, partial [Pristionchus entomophagus]
FQVTTPILSQGRMKSIKDFGKSLEDFFIRSFYNYGLILGRNPGPFLWVPLLCTLACVPGLFMLRINLDLYRLFVPTDAPVRTEHERTQDFNRMPGGNLNMPPHVSTRVPRDVFNNDFEFSLDQQMGLTFDPSLIGREENHTRVRRETRGAPIALPMGKAGEKSDILRFYVVHKDHENILSADYLGPLYRYTNEMMKVTHEFEGKTYAMEDFCMKGNGKSCDNNLNVWIKHADVLFSSGKIRNNPNLQLSYPVMYLFNRPKDIGNVIYGVNVTGEKNEIQGARVLTLHWFVAYKQSHHNDLAYIAWRDALMEFWHTKEAESDFVIIPHNDKAMDDEMMKIIETTVPFAFPATVMLMLFVVFSNWSTDRTKSKPMEMYLGVWAVILALIITFGLFFYFGAAFNPVTSTMPFLVLTVGVDDDFLMIAAWRELDRRLSVERRIALVMGDAGASITVTSFTNFFCFGLGYFLCSTPAVADFCLITAFGVFIDYIMQITFFAAVLTYSGRREDEGGLASCCYKKTVVTPAVTDAENGDASAIRAEIKEAKWKVSEENDEDFDPTHHGKAEEIPYMHAFFRDKFVPFIIRPDVKVVSWIFFGLYCCIAFYGCCLLKVDISPVKYIRDNSPIQTFVALADKYIWADNVMPAFHVMAPPDFRDPVVRAKFNAMVFQLEHTDYSIGRVSTNFWLWQYQQYLNDFPDVDYKTEFYKRSRLNDFFNQLDYSQYRPMIKILDNVTDGEPCIAAFTFQTSFYGLDSWDKRQAELFHWRAILNAHPQYDMFLSGIFSPFLIDQRRTIAPSSMQTIGCALAMMALTSIFFLPDAQSVFLMTWCLLSISMGVCGGLALLGSDLDSVSMGCIVMAIGMAIDYSVHICYRYHRSEERRSAAKVVDSLTSVAWPITQAVSSTLFGLCSTAFVPAYLVRVFFQTVYLVSIIGLAHSLVWLPQLISAIDPCERVPLRKRVQA